MLPAEIAGLLLPYWCGGVLITWMVIGYRYAVIEARRKQDYEDMPRELRVAFALLLSGVFWPMLLTSSIGALVAKRSEEKARAAEIAEKKAAALLASVDKELEKP